VGGVGVPALAGGGGVIGLLVLLAAVLLGGGGGTGGLSGFGEVLGEEPAGPATQDEDFVEFLAEDTQAVWADIFAEEGRQYSYATVNTFTGQVQTGCGGATSAVGPFYCPADGQVYLDLGFFDELARRFQAPGDFAQAYVIAHEFGHHVQNLLGIDDDVRRGQQQHPDETNELSVRLELQADCFAGVWGHSALERQDVAPAEVKEALDAAAAIGDDRIQRSTQGRVDPESFTHGSSEQRVRWFRKGFDSGDPNGCDTFKGDV
jgi:hypothetical protein